MESAIRSLFEDNATLIIVDDTHNTHTAIPWPLKDIRLIYMSLAESLYSKRYVATYRGHIIARGKTECQSTLMNLANFATTKIIELSEERLETISELMAGMTASNVTDKQLDGLRNLLKVEKQEPTN